MLEVEDRWRLWRWRWCLDLGLWLFGLLAYGVREAGLRLLQYFCKLSVIISRIPQGVLRDLLFLLVSLGTCLLPL